MAADSMPTLTKAGQQLVNALLEAKVLSGDLTKPVPSWLFPSLNAAAEILMPAGEGAGLREALKPFLAEADRIDPPGNAETTGDSVQIWQNGSFDITRSRITYGDLRRLRAALASQQPAVEGPVAAGAWPDRPDGAIYNGRENLRRLAEHYTFETTEGGSLTMCADYHDAVRCFEVLAGYVATLTPPADPKTPDAGVGEDIRGILTEARSGLHAFTGGEDGSCRATIAKIDAVLQGSPAPVGEDETGVREALKALVEHIHASRYRCDRTGLRLDANKAVFDQAERALAAQPVPSAQSEEQCRLWDAIHDAMICAWNLLDGTEDGVSGVDKADWSALSASMTALERLVPKEDQPFSPSYAVPYLRALTAQLPNAEPPSGVGDKQTTERAMMRIEAEADAWVAETPDIGKMVGMVAHGWPPHLRGRAAAQADALVRQTFVEAFYRGFNAHKDHAAALSAAPGIRSGDGVERWRPVSEANQEELVVLGWWQFSTLGFQPRWNAEVGRACDVGSATHFCPLPATPTLTAAPAANGEGA